MCKYFEHVTDVSNRGNCEESSPMSCEISGFHGGDVPDYVLLG